MKLWPDLALGGNSPVQDSFKHSIMVCKTNTNTQKKIKSKKIHVRNRLSESKEEREREGVENYGFPGAVGTDNEGQGPEEGDDILVLRVEAPYPFDQHLIHRTHLLLFTYSNGSLSFAGDTDWQTNAELLLLLLHCKMEERAGLNSISTGPNINKSPSWCI